MKRVASGLFAPAVPPAAPGPAGDPLGAYRLVDRPFYQPRGREVEWFEAAYGRRLPMLLKGPTGSGKTRFVEHMAWRLGRPLVTVSCHEDLGASDLLGRWLLDGEGVRWQDGPLTLAARHGALCYLDELIEARPDATVVIHPLTDTRRILPLAPCNEVVHAHADFQLVVSYNPAPMAREMKSATRQRFCALEFDYPDAEREAGIVAHETGVALAQAVQLVAFGLRTRRLQSVGLEEGASTRMLVHAGQLMVQGLDLQAACSMALVDPLSDDHAVRDALQAALEAAF